MTSRLSFVGLGAAGLVGLLGSPVYARCRREMGAARKRLDELGSEVLETRCGPIEYAARGEGYPVLVIHGIFGGFDQGLVDAGNTFSEGYRLIVPSRFGIPADAAATWCLRRKSG
jgi:2-hydroxy-6-oxonona-2,4-dienedioate hydrolase